MITIQFMSRKIKNMISFLIDSKEKQYNIAQFNLLLE